MQTNLSSPSSGADGGAGIVATYGYAARYLYSDVVERNSNVLRLTPAADANQSPLSTSVTTRPVSPLNRSQDTYGNTVHQSSIDVPHQALTIFAYGVVRFESPKVPPGELSLDSLSYDSTLDLYLTATPLVHPESLSGPAQEIAGTSGGLLESVESVVQWVYRNIRYVKESTTVTTTAAEALEAGEGVCQDMAHLAMGMLKALGIPSRYVCGLLATEVGETHAWLEFWHPREGWVPSDPTRGQAVVPRGELIKFAVGRDYTEAAPLEGTFVSRGSGWLDTAIARVRFDRDSITFDDTLGLIESAP